MTREEAIIILDEVIPPPEHHTVDLDHLRIAQAWLCIKEMLTVEPIKHGRWKHHQYGNTAGYYVCDNCGKINSYESNYCPKCGAKMDEVSDCEACQNRKTCKDAPIPSRYDCLGYKSDEVEDE